MYGLSKYYHSMIIHLEYSFAKTWSMTRVVCRAWLKAIYKHRRYPCSSFRHGILYHSFILPLTNPTCDSSPTVRSKPSSSISSPLMVDCSATNHFPSRSSNPAVKLCLAVYSGNHLPRQVLVDRCRRQGRSTSRLDMLIGVAFATSHVLQGR